MLTEDDTASLARFAGLSIASERLPALFEELNAVLALIEDLAIVPDSELEAVTGSFDPTWTMSEDGDSV